MIDNYFVISKENNLWKNREKYEKYRRNRNVDFYRYGDVQEII